MRIIYQTIQLSKSIEKTRIELDEKSNELKELNDEVNELSEQVEVFKNKSEDGTITLSELSEFKDLQKLTKQKISDFKDSQKTFKLKAKELNKESERLIKKTRKMKKIDFDRNENLEGVALQITILSVLIFFGYFHNLYSPASEDYLFYEFVLWSMFHFSIFLILTYGSILFNRRKISRLRKKFNSRLQQPQS